MEKTRKFPVTSSAPVKTIIMRPKGMPKPPKTKLFWPVVPPQRPPTWEDMRAPRPRNKPPRRERKKSLAWPYCAFFLVALMNCSSTSGLVNCARRESDMMVPGWMPDMARACCGVVTVCVGREEEGVSARGSSRSGLGRVVRGARVIMTRARRARCPCSIGARNFWRLFGRIAFRLPFGAKRQKDFPPSVAKLDTKYSYGSRALVKNSRRCAPGWREILSPLPACRRPPSERATLRASCSPPATWREREGTSATLPLAAHPSPTSCASRRSLEDARRDRIGCTT